MRQMWQTPVAQFSLLGRGILAEDLDRLSSEILDYYYTFLESSMASTSEADASISDLFYRAQQAEDLEFKTCVLQSQSKKDRSNCVSQRPSLFADLSRLFLYALNAYLVENYLPVLPINHNSPSLSSLPNDHPLWKVFAWTSLHGNGSYHPAHHHVDSSISAVLYIKTPPGSGDLVFHDPRGSLPPFGKTLHVNPQAGDLVLFPGYLLHTVEPTITKGLHRISVSFNFQGDWSLLGDVNSAYYTN